MNEYEIASDLGFNQSEFELLSQFMLHKKPQIDWKVCDFEDYIRYILEIRRQIKINSVSSNIAFLESSHLGLIRQAYQKNYFQYSYQRYDLKLIDENWLDRIYNIQDPCFSSNGLFVKSGMSAFLVSILTLKRLYPSFTSLHYAKDGYFEVNDMFTRYLNLYNVSYFSEENQRQPDIVILDSTTAIVDKIQWINAKIIIIDTTCWATTDPIINNLLGHLKDYSGLILLVRSHIKLDCFGLEINRLGSIVILVNTSLSNDMHQFKDACHETTCNIGCNFNIEDCYPWLFYKKFHELCKMRTNRIKYYTNKICDRLIKEKDIDFPVYKGQHDLFIMAKFTRIPKSFNKKFKFGNPVMRYARQVCEIAKKIGLPVVPSSSFGLCYSSFDGYLNRAGTEAYLRLAPSPNMSETQADQIADFFIEWFAKGNRYQW